MSRPGVMSFEKDPLVRGRWIVRQLVRSDEEAAEFRESLEALVARFNKHYGVNAEVGKLDDGSVT